MFDLEQAVQGWKQTFRPDNPIGVDERQEIETHLRESVERLSGSGLSEQEAFAVSVHRLGCTGALEAEFAKNQPVAQWRARLAWMLGGYVVFTICRDGAWAIAQLSSAAMAYGGALPIVAGPMALAVLTFAWIALLAISYLAIISSKTLAKQFTWKWAALAGLALYFLPAGSFYGQLAQKSFRDEVWYDETGLWIGYGSFILKIVGCLVCFVILHKLSKPTTAMVE